MKSSDFFYKKENKTDNILKKMVQGLNNNKMLIDGNFKPVEYIIADVNDVFQRLTGLSKEDVVGKNISEITVQEKKDCSYISVFYDEKEYFKNILDDIVYLEQTRKSLKEMEERCHFALKSNQDAVWDLSVETGELYICSRFKEIMGFEAKEKINHIEDYYKYIHSHDLTKAKTEIEEHSIGKIPYICVEFRVICRDGKYKWLLCRGKASYYSEEGRPVRIIGTVMDITERKEIEEDLKQREEQFRTIFDHSTLGICLIEPEHLNLLKVNSAFCKMLDYSEQELTDKNLISITHPEDMGVFVEKINQLMQGTVGKYTLEKRCIKKNNQIIWINLSASAIINKTGKVLYILGITENITERKKSEELLKTMAEENKNLLEKAIENDRLKTDFFSNISHEFKTPLNVILSIIQLVSMDLSKEDMGIDKQKISKHIGMMKQNCYRLLRLINNLIDITKIDSGFLQLLPANHNIINIVEDIILSVAEFAKNNDIDMVFDTEVEEKIIACDADKVERIILNLISNAIKYTDPGGSIYVNIKDLGENILISIKDTGIGIPENMIQAVFERFRQVDSSLKRVNEGSGIGLSLVKSLVEMHEGEIWAESEYGKGTAFYIKFPAKVLSEKENDERYDNNNALVEKINIEFSDIYMNALNISTKE